MMYENIYGGKSKGPRNIIKLNEKGEKIKDYVLNKYNISLDFAIEVARILEKTLLQDNKLNSGMYDDVIYTVIKQKFPAVVSSFSDKSINDENIFRHSKDSDILQQKNEQLLQKTILLSEEELDKVRNSRI